MSLFHCAEHGIYGPQGPCPTCGRPGAYVFADATEPQCDSKASVAYVTRADGRILCVWNHTHLTWGLPGGKAEPGEDFAHACEREPLEETGVEAQILEPVFQAPSSSGSGRMVMAFVVTLLDDGKEPRQIEDDSPIAWLRRDDLLKWSKFESYYRPMFAAIDARTEPHQPPPAITTPPDVGSDAEGAARAKAVSDGETSRADGGSWSPEWTPPTEEQIRKHYQFLSDGHAFAVAHLGAAIDELRAKLTETAHELAQSTAALIEVKTDNAELRLRLDAAQQRILELQAETAKRREETP